MGGMFLIMQRVNVTTPFSNGVSQNQDGNAPRSKLNEHQIDAACTVAEESVDGAA